MQVQHLSNKTLIRGNSVVVVVVVVVRFGTVVQSSFQKGCFETGVSSEC